MTQPQRIEIDGARYSGSGTIVRQAVALAALTRRSLRIVHVRERRAEPGLRRQHLSAVLALRDLVGGLVDGAVVGSRELSFEPGAVTPGQAYAWDIGSAGSTTLLALAVLPVLLFAPGPSDVELRGGLFQDFAPSFFHLQHVMLPLLAQMGLQAEVEMERPGYVPRGGGILRLHVHPLQSALRPLVREELGGTERIWGIALASHLAQRRVAARMAEAAERVLASAGLTAAIECREETGALQAGAALVLFADLAGGARLAADRAGAPRRPSEAIGAFVARQLLEELGAGATIDRYAADQIVLFAALAEGESRFRLPQVTEHMQTSAWLASEFLGVQVRIENRLLIVDGRGFPPAF